MLLIQKVVVGLLIAMIPVFAFAQTEPPQFVTVDGRLYDSTSPTTPLLDANVSMRIQVLNPAKTCILYEEQQSVSTLASGYFNARVGSPTAGMDSLKRTALDSGNSMSLVFQNQNAPITGLTAGGLGCNYTPSPGESRFFRFIVTPSTTGVTSTLSPDMTIDSVPQSLVAETLQGFASDDFLQISANVTQAKAESLFGGSYASLTSLLSGTSSLYLQNTANGTVIPSRPSDPAAPSAGQIWYDSTTNELKYYDGGAVQTVGTGTGLDATKLPLAGGTMAGAINMGSNDITSVGHITQSPQRTFRFGGYTGGQETTLLGTLIPGQEGTMWYNTTTDKVMYFDGTGSQELLTSTSANSLVPNCNADESLQMSAGPIYLWSCVATTDSTKLALAGGAMTGALTMNAQNQVRYADADSSNYAALQSPAVIGANYVLTLPVDDGTPGQVLQTDGNGLLSWLTIPSAPVSTVFGRSGAVVAVAGDYYASQVDNTPAGNIAATDVQAALNELDSEKAINARNINTNANSGLAGGGDLSADRNLTVDITGTTALGTAADNADEVLIYDASGSVLRKVTRSQLNLSESEVDAFVANNGFAADADKVNRAGDTMTGSLNIDNEQELRLSEADGSGANYVALKSPTTLAANYTLTFPVDDGNNGQYLMTDGNGVLTWVTPAGVGETNTASNQGVGGIGVFDAKSGVDLQFRNINAASNKVTVALDAGNKEIDINVDEANFALGSIPNTPAGTIAATNAQAAINELDTEKVASTRAINTNANSGLAGGGDLSADRNITVDIAGTTAETAVAGADEILIWDASASALRKMTRTNFVLSEAEVDAMISNNGFLTAEADTFATVTGRGASTATNITMNTQAQVRYADAAGGEYAAIQAPATLGANYVLTLPVSDGGVGEVLSTDGNGVLSWIAIPSAPVSTVFGRSGAVVAVAGDYDANQVDNTPAGNIAATDVQAALNELDTEKAINARNINTNANSGLAGGGDLSADRNLTVDITGTTALGAAADNADEVLIYDASGSVLRKVTRSQLNLSESEVDAFVANNGFAADADKVNRAGDTMTGALNIDNEQELRLSEADGSGANYVALKSPTTLGANYTLTFPVDDGNNGQYLMTDGNGVLSWVTPAGVGETNTASNVTGSTGVGIFKQKSTFDLQFKSLLPGSNKLSISGGADDVTLDVVETNLNLGNIPNTPAGTIAATNAQAAINELDTEKVGSARAINTNANSGLAGGGDLSADRNLTVDITGTTALGAGADNADEVLIYDASGSVLRKVTRSQLNLSEAEVDAMISNNGFLTAEADTLATVTGRGASTATSITMNTQAQMQFADAAGGEYAAIQAPATIGANYVLTLPADDGTANQVLTTDGNGLLTWTTPASAGEVNTASNQGVGGIGVFDAKSGVDLQFRNINAASNKVSVVLDGPNKEIDINVDEANFALGSIPNTAAGNIAATNAQAAINELDSEKVAKAGDTMTGQLVMGPRGLAAGDGGAVAFAELAAGGTETATIRAPDALGSSYALTLPIDDGTSGQVLSTDGNGVLSWIAAGTNISPDSLNFTDLADALVLDASTDISVTGTNVLSFTNSGTGATLRVNDEAADASPFIIDADGNVGVGTTTPSDKLDIYQSANSASSMTVTTPGTLSAHQSLVSLVTNGDGSTLGSATNKGWQLLARGNAFAVGSQINDLGFSYWNGSSWYDAFRIDSVSGNVGIGTSDPGETLDVNGTIMSRPNGAGTGQTGRIMLRELAAGGTETAAIRAPDALGASYALTLPVDDGTPGQVLSTDGSGILSWIAPGSTISADSLNFTDLADALLLDASTDISVTGTNIFSITNSGTADSFVVNDAAGDTTPFIIDANGNVGIGTTSSGSALQVGDSNGFASPKQIYVAEFDSSGASRPSFVGNWGESGGWGLGPEGGSATIRLGRVGGPNSDWESTQDMNFVVGARIGVGTAGVPSNTVHARVSDAATNTNTNLLRLEHESTGTPAADFGTGLLFTGESTTTSNQDMAQISSIWTTATHASRASALTFSTVTGAGSLTERVRIDGSGSVGIGTTAPSTLLDVSGAITSRPRGTLTGETGQIIMRELAAGGSETATIRAPDALGASYALTLPADDGTPNQVLTTDGSGLLTWTTPSALPAADTVNFTELADALVLDASTDISVTSNYVLSVTNSGTGNSFLVNDAAGDTSPFVIDASGNVGIGTTTPDTQLSVNVAAHGSAFDAATSSTWADVLITNPIDSLSAATGIKFLIDASGNSTTAGAGIAAVKAHGTGYAADLVFVVDPNAASSLEAVRITSTGSVGIGTTIPSTLLDIAGAITSRPSGTLTGETGQLMMRELAINGTNTATIRAPDALGANYVLTLPVDDGTSGQVLQTDGNGLLSWISPASAIADDGLNFDKLADALVLDASTDIALDGAEILSITNTGTANSFVVNDQAGDTSPFVIDTNGNVAIGTTTASSKLEVNGRIVSSLGTDGDALTALTVDFSAANVIDATGASAACGTLNITNTVSGGSFTVTMPNATATCTTIHWNGSATGVKLPAGYVGGIASAGLVYSFIHSGSFLWVTNVTY